MSNPISDAVALCGGPKQLAGRLNVTAQAVRFWQSGERRLPVQHCSEIERATKGAVRRWHLRPRDWHLIWPELVGAEGAPPVPAAVEAGALS